MDKYNTTQHPLSIMKFDEKFASSRGYRSKNTFRKRKQQKKQKFIETEQWVSKKKDESDSTNIKLTNTNFPELNPDTACKITEHKITYSIQELFKKKREKKKKKEELKPGWIKLYYKDGNICQISGPPTPPCYDATGKLMEIEIQKMIERHEIYEEWDELNHYIPYWKEQDTMIYDELDYYPGYTESEEEDYEYDESTDDEYYDN